MCDTRFEDVMSPCCCHVVQVIESGVDVPDDLAVDWVARNIYWTDYRLETIEVATLSGEHRTILFATNVTNARAISLDPSEG